jgi:hypothetical protein
MTYYLSASSWERAMPTSAAKSVLISPIAVSPTRNEIWNTGKVTRNTCIDQGLNEETDLREKIIFNLLGDG